MIIAEHPLSGRDRLRWSLRHPVRHAGIHEGAIGGKPREAQASEGCHRAAERADRPLRAFRDEHQGGNRAGARRPAQRNVRPMNLLHFFRKPALSETRKNGLLSFARKDVSPHIRGMETEFCFNIETSAPLNGREIETLKWLLAETFEPEQCSPGSFLARDQVLEVGPRMNFTTAWSTNAVSVFQAGRSTKTTR